MFNNKKKKDNFVAEEVEEVIELDEEKEDDKDKEALPFVSYRDEKASIFEKEDLTSPPEHPESKTEDTEALNHSPVDKEFFDNRLVGKEDYPFDYSAYAQENHTSEHIHNLNEEPSAPEVEPASDGAFDYKSFTNDPESAFSAISEEREGMSDEETETSLEEPEKAFEEGDLSDLSKPLPKKTFREKLQARLKRTEAKTLTVEQGETTGEESALPSSEEGISLESINEEQLPVKKGLKFLKIKGNNRKLFFLLAGLLSIGIGVALIFLPNSDDGFLKSLFGGEKDLLAQSPATLPITDTSNPYIEDQGSEGPFLEEVTEETVDKNLPIEDAYTEELKTRLAPVFLAFNSNLTEVSKTKGVIQIKGTVYTDDLLEINRLVRMAQSTSYPFLIEGLNSTNVQLLKGKSLYAFETNKTVIEFIAKLNYEDRHSAQMWWSKTSAHKNGRNLKASLIKDRLYVDYPHPIFGEPPVKEEVVTEVEEGASIEKPLNPEDYDTYKEYEDTNYGLFFEYPQDIEVGGSIDTESSKLTVISKTDKILPLSFKVQAGEENIEGTDEEKLSKFFAASTNTVEKALGNFKITSEESADTNFTGQKFLIRNYTIKESTADYSVIIAATIIENKTYLFTITHSAEKAQDAKWIYKSSNLGETASPSVDSEPQKDVTSEGCSIKGDKQTKTYYMNGDAGYNSVAEGTYLMFCDEDSATKAGYKKGE